MIGAVVPVFDRRDNLELLLASLERQTTTGFNLVVADDGSTDGTRQLIEHLSAKLAWRGRLRWVSCGPHQGVRTGRARNIGAANLDTSTELLVMLDSDLVLQPDAMALFAAAHHAHPEHVILGPVAWLPPMNRVTVLDAIASGDVRGLRQQVPDGTPMRVEGTFVGPELRAGLSDSAPAEPLPMRPEWALPLNSAWPLDLYWRIGGLDEGMNGYGYQDVEFGARAAKAGTRCVAHPELWGLHVWHPKPSRALVENQRNLDYYLRRHGSNTIVETDIDWRLWWHYHAKRGGKVACYGKRLWAIDSSLTHRLALPDEGWLSRLGHCEHAGEPRDLSGVTNHGTATEVAGS